MCNLFILYFMTFLFGASVIIILYILIVKLRLHGVEDRQLRMTTIVGFLTFQTKHRNPLSVLKLRKYKTWLFRRYTLKVYC